MSAHPTELLRQWKLEAESNALTELGKRLPSSSDVREEVTSILTGTPTLVPAVIANAHAAAQEALATLDARFSLSTSHANGVTTISVDAREPVTLRMDITNTPGNEAFKRMDALFSDGDPAEIPLDSVKITGSPLFDHMVGEARKSGTGSLRFEPPKQPGIMKITLIHPKGGRSIQLDDSSCFIQPGFSKLTIRAPFFDQSLSLTISVDTAIQNTSTFNLKINFDSWAGRTVESLFALDDLHEFLRSLVEGWGVELRVKSKGKTATMSTIHIDADFAREVLVLVNHIVRVRTLSRFIKRDIIFQHTGIEARDQVILKNFLTGVNPHGLISQNSPLREDPVVTVEVRASDYLKSTMKDASALRVSIHERFSEEFRVFGTPFRLPTRKITFSGVVPHVISESGEIKDGQEVKIRLERTSEFAWDVICIDEPNPPISPSSSVLALESGEP